MKRAVLYSRESIFLYSCALFEGVTVFLSEIKVSIAIYLPVILRFIEADKVWFGDLTIHLYSPASPFLTCLRTIDPLTIFTSLGDIVSRAPFLYQVYTREEPPLATQGSTASVPFKTF